MDKIELKLDETNELFFKVVIEGSKEPATAVRFVCAGDDLSYIFRGDTTSEVNEIRVLVPPMMGKLKEGLYEGHLEILIDGRHLVPLRLQAQFSPGMKVVAESVQVAQLRQKLEITATASPKVRTVPAAKPVVKEEVTIKHKTLAEKFGHSR